MTQLNSQPQSDAQPVSAATDDPQSVMLSRLKALQTEVPDKVTGPSRFRNWWIGGGISIAVLLMIFIAAAVWRRALPSDVRLDGDWVRVVDRQWGFQIELPNWYRKEYHDSQSVQYSTRLSNYGDVKVQIYNWQRKNFKPTTAATELASIVALEQRSRPVKIVADRSKDLASPMIDFISTCGQAGGYQWHVRQRVMIQRDVMVRIHIGRWDDVPPAEVERMMESAQWLRQISSK